MFIDENLHTVRTLLLAYYHNLLTVVWLYFLVCYRLSDLAFVLDASGSIEQDSFEKSKIMVKKLVQTFPPEKGYRHAAVVYGKKPFVEFNFISSANNRLKTSDLLERITRIPYYKSTMTRIDAALRLVKKKVFPGDKDLKARKKVKKPKNTAVELSLKLRIPSQNKFHIK